MTTPNPACNINGGATPADVSATATVNGALVSSAGANFWSVTCIATDDANTVAAVNATLSVNQGAKTFSFTSLTAPSAYIFQSVVGISGLGIDANGAPQPSFTTTFKVNVKTAGGRRVLAAGEQFEQDAVHGWINEINAAIRALG